MTRRDAPVIAAVSFGAFLWILDALAVTVALADIRRDLDADNAALQWVVDAYAVVFAALLLAAGTLGDRFGSRRVYVIGLWAFLVASAACAAAPSAVLLVTARAVQGVAGALLVPSSLALLRHAFPHNAGRARAIGAWAAITGAAGVMGPLVGGVLVDAGGWRLVFLANLPVCALGAVLSARVLPEPPSAHAGRLDLIAHSLLIVGLGALVLVVIEAPRRGLADGLVLAAAALVASAAVLGAVHHRTHPNGLLPARFFAGVTVRATTLVGLLHNFGGYGTVFVLSLYLQLARDWSALETGLAFLPMPLAMAALSPLAGALVRRVGARTLMATGMALGAVGTGALAFAGPDTPYPLLALALAALGGGTGLAVPAMTAVMLVAVPAEHAGVAGAVLSTARQVGTALGVATVGALATRTGDILDGLPLALGVATAALLGGSALALAWVRRLRGSKPLQPAPALCPERCSVAPLARR